MTNKVYLSKKQAKLELRRAGFSVAAAEAAVAAMPKIIFGKRDKVKASDLRAVVNRAAEPSPEQQAGSSISAKLFREIRETYQRPF